jgi:flavin reductase (DIM6/NTAB) family NADH-FMN oxidoreductase RutF
MGKKEYFWRMVIPLYSEDIAKKVGSGLVLVNYIIRLSRVWNKQKEYLHMKTIDPKELAPNEVYTLLVGSVVPRPIAFASTIDKIGGVNLSPFSFFNAFGSNPPVVIFSPVHRTRDDTPKDTYTNLTEVPETVVNIVTHDIVEQMSLSSTEYGPDVDEFTKSGLTPIPSVMVKPPRVKESPVSFECKVLEIKTIGSGGGAANLVIAEVILIHINESILDAKGYIDPYKLHPVGRLGGPYYVDVSKDNIFKIRRPTKWKGIGVDAFPDHVRQSTILTGNDLGKLGNVEKLPSKEEIEQVAAVPEIRLIIENYQGQEHRNKLHELARTYLEKNDIETAWKILMTN